ncbi:MAG TPA: hypothetical protein VLT33_04950 [Labilithrix sp.]|nr:hypothetical protein [Labilithrix sp.]
MQPTASDALVALMPVLRAPDSAIKAAASSVSSRAGRDVDER